MKLYKLTDSDGYTRKGGTGETKWYSGKTLSIDPKLRNNTLCTNGVVHAYANLNLALLLNPIHADIDKPLVWEVEGDVVVEDWVKLVVTNLQLSTNWICPIDIGTSTMKS